MKFRRILYLIGSALSFTIVFVIDVIRKNVELDIGGMNLFRDILIVAAFALIYLYLEAKRVHDDLPPAKRLGLVMIYSVAMLFVSIMVWNLTEDNFDTKGDSLIPLTFGQLFIAKFVSVLFGIFAILVFRLVRTLILYKRKRGTERNFLLFVGLTLATALSTFPLKPLDQSTLTYVLLGLAILFAVINSFRLPWIVYLTKREKLFTLIYGFVLFGAFLGLNFILFMDQSVIRKSLLYYSYPMNRFVVLTTILGNIYFGMAFVSTLFHLPTAEAFDRKSTEVTSLHNLSRLVTQVFDFNELVDTVLSMTLQVCEAKSSWLEIIHVTDEQEQLPVSGGEIIRHSRNAQGVDLRSLYEAARLPARTALAGGPDGQVDRRLTTPHGSNDPWGRRQLVEESSTGSYTIQLAGRKNIGEEEIDTLLSAGEKTLRDEVIKERKPIVVEDISHDVRFKSIRKSQLPVGSMVVVPLVSHAGMIGILYATKELPFGFFKDDIDVISAFADQATIAIENSRLIKKSLERERLLREMTLAQEIQRKLLPQLLPKYPTMEIDAVSTPAFEVGGDYYDVIELEGSKLGIIVGDVSGKGVSAAFYMAEVKGIFQSLSRLYPSPREFMIKANEALSGSIDKHSFVSLLYAVVDVKTGKLTQARAGHCPLLHLSGEQASYLRPGGMGLGLSNGSAFGMSMEETTIHLKPGDVCVFYTDGVTEARQGDDEFGYERLMQTVISSKEKSACALKEDILRTVKAHADKEENDDDLTVMVLKWFGTQAG